MSADDIKEGQSYFCCAPSLADEDTDRQAIPKRPYQAVAVIEATGFGRIIRMRRIDGASGISSEDTAIVGLSQIFASRAAANAYYLEALHAAIHERLADVTKLCEEIQVFTENANDQNQKPNRPG